MTVSTMCILLSVVDSYKFNFDEILDDVFAEGDEDNIEEGVEIRGFGVVGISEVLIIRDSKIVAIYFHCFGVSYFNNFCNANE